MCGLAVAPGMVCHQKTWKQARTKQGPSPRSDASSHSCGTTLGSETSAEHHDTLACDEGPLEQDCVQGQAADSAAPTSANDLLCFAAMARNEHQRCLEVCPCPAYLERHLITAAHRTVSVGWLMEAAEACQFHAATLFQAVAYFDRFCSSAKDVSPGMLQLVATASLSIAAKTEEVLQPTAAEWASIADDSFSVKDLVHMEFLLLHYLGWRVRTPTVYTFLQLFGMASMLDGSVLKAALRITELALFDYGMLRFSYSTIAASGLLVAHRVLGLHFELRLLMERAAPYLSETDVERCSSALMQLHAQAQQQRGDEQERPGAGQQVHAGERAGRV